MDPENPPSTVYHFDRFRLDLAGGALLTSEGQELPLRPKSFALLQLLVENAGRLLDRDTIMQAVWPDVFVTDDSITQCVRDIRRALGDEAQRLLRTVPRRGYRFLAEVSCAGPAKTEPRESLRPLPGQPPRPLRLCRSSGRIGGGQASTTCGKILPRTRALMILPARNIVCHIRAWFRDSIPSGRRHAPR
jgi:DNA-binding winged helix-turn-helix (wHTH) protein